MVLAPKPQMSITETHISIMNNTRYNAQFEKECVSQEIAATFYIVNSGNADGFTTVDLTVRDRFIVDRNKYFVKAGTSSDQKYLSGKWPKCQIGEADIAVKINENPTSIDAQPATSTATSSSTNNITETRTETNTTATITTTSTTSTNQIVSGNGGGVKLPSYANQNDRITQAYLASVKMKELFEYMPCYCGCSAMAHPVAHNNLRDCFHDENGVWNQHAAECSTCVDIAMIVWTQLNEGKRPIDVRNLIDKQYSNGNYPPPTPTPMPPA